MSKRGLKDILKDSCASSTSYNSILVSLSQTYLYLHTKHTHTHTHTGTEKLSDDFLRNILRAAKQSQKFEEKLDDMYAYVVFECGVRVLIFENFHLVITRI